ncbi:DUF547 domain-containing protein, partial [bacterium]|nr:DUF547 domain-containing protein [bacterium]
VFAMSSPLAEGMSEEKTSLFDKVLQRHVKDGLVDYEAVAKDGDFAAFLSWLADADSAKLGHRADEIAFWVNAYNALAIKGVLDNSPVEKVIHIPGFFKEQKHPVAGTQLTLDEIEKEVIFKKFKEPLLHFVLVCAAISCPNLPSRAYTGEDLMEQMQAVTRSFLNNDHKNRYDGPNNTVFLSQIFNWYKADFETDSKSVIDFIRPYLNEKNRKLVSKESLNIAYLEYDWSLNSQ